MLGRYDAAPDEINQQVRAECSRVIDFAESHRSSPAVLRMVNTLAPLTSGTTLTAADPNSWPAGGLAAQTVFNTPDDEADWVLKFSEFVLSRAPNHRIGIIARTAGRRRFVDELLGARHVPA